MNFVFSKTGQCPAQFAQYFQEWCSKMQVDYFKPEDFDEIDPQERQIPFIVKITPAARAALSMQRFAYTGRLNGKVVFCAGVVELWPGRGEAWAVFDKSLKGDFIKVFHVIRRFLDGCGIKRIETSVDCSFADGHRWMKALDFVCEAPVRKAYGIFGEDTALYARVKGASSWV
jgi:hypothetical protein